MADDCDLHWPQSHDFGDRDFDGRAAGIQIGACLTTSGQVLALDPLTIGAGRHAKPMPESADKRFLMLIATLQGDIDQPGIMQHDSKRATLQPQTQYIRRAVSPIAALNVRCR